MPSKFLGNLKIYIQTSHHLSASVGKKSSEIQSSKKNSSCSNLRNNKNEKYKKWRANKRNEKGILMMVMNKDPRMMAVHQEYMTTIGAG